MSLAQTYYLNNVTAWYLHNTVWYLNCYASGWLFSIGTMSAPPSEIRYSQDSISSRFRDGHRLSYTFAELLYGRISVFSLGSMECLQKDGHWWAVSGNRRLYVFKKLQEAGKISTISFCPAFASRSMTTNSSGLSVRIRGGSTESEIQNIIYRSKRGDSFEAVTVGLNDLVQPQRRSRDRFGSWDSDDDLCGSFGYGGSDYDSDF